MIDQTFRFQLDLFRLDAETRARVQPILDKLERELTAVLSAGDLASKRRAAQLLAEAQDIIARAYSEAQALMLATTEGLAPIAASAARDALDSMLPPSITATLPTAAALEALATDALIQGAPQAAWWERQSADTAWRFVTAVRQGLAAGETNNQIIARIVGRAGFPGVMEISRRNAAALVQTGIATVSNNARMATFAANDDLIAAYRWVTALDGHVCPRCAARADLAWGTDHEPKGHGIAWATPPIHFNDRCVLIPETKTWRELGIDMPEVPQGTRASRDGPVPQSTTFRSWLDGKSAAYQDEALGPGRAQLWRDGRITLQDLVNGRGNPLTLEELRARYAG